MQFKKSESKEKPIQIDEKSSQGGVYVRICITEKQKDEETYFEYLEAFLTKAEWEQYKLVAKMQGETLDAPTIEYNFKMNVPVKYPVEAGGNGFTYKPIWAEKVYASKISTLTAFPELLPIAIYDSTNKEERMQKMTIEQLKALSLYLGNVQLQYFEIKKQQQAELAND